MLLFWAGLNVPSVHLQQVEVKISHKFRVRTSFVEWCRRCRIYFFRSAFYFKTQILLCTIIHMWLFSLLTMTLSEQFRNPPVEGHRIIYTWLVASIKCLCSTLFICAIWKCFRKKKYWAPKGTWWWGKKMRWEQKSC